MFFIPQRWGKNLGNPGVELYSGDPCVGISELGIIQFGLDGL